jgi:F-type H+-transporting ATPase subunit b
MTSFTSGLTLVGLLLAAGVAAASGGGHGEGGGGTWTGTLLAWRVVNTVALIALLVYFVKKPLVDFFKGRTAQIEAELAEAREQRTKAEQTIKEYEAKIAGMAQEIERMKAELAKAAAAEKEKVLANADRMAQGIVEAAKIAAQQEVRKVKMSLRHEAVDLAVAAAEAIIKGKIGPNDHKQMVDDYLARIEALK